MWNKKKQHLLLVIEVFFSFLVIFALGTMAVYFYRNFRQPLGLVDKDVWVVRYTNAGSAAPADSLALFYNTIRQSVASMPEVRDVSFSSFNTPFGNGVNITSFDHDNNHVHDVYNFYTGDQYANVLGMKLVEGRWFGKEDDAAAHEPVIINQTLEKAAFGDVPAAGQLIGSGPSNAKPDTHEEDAHKRRIIGVVADVKTNGDYRPTVPSMWVRVDTGSFNWINTMLVKVSPDADATTEGKLFKSLSNLMKKSDVSISHLSHDRENIDNEAIVPVIIFAIVAAFLVINVAFGLFGVLWYNINKRRSEIGLRRAVGASGWSVSNQLWVETLILATFAIVLGTFFAIQFPLLHVFNLKAGVYIAALIFAILFIYVLVTICSLYPGRQAAAIFPAEALHED